MLHVSRLAREAEKAVLIEHELPGHDGQCGEDQQGGQLKRVVHQHKRKS